MLELTTKLVLIAVSKMAININPLTLEWLLHYVNGKQKEKTLPKELHSITKIHVVKTLLEEAAFSPSTLWGHAMCHSYRGDDSWYTHPTKGIVGGFIYKLISYEDKFVIKCIDDWDFNTHLMYTIPLPQGIDLTVIRPILKKMGIQLSIQEDSVGVSESFLSQFNNKHRFRTTWEIELPIGMCMPINHPLKETWIRQHSHKRRKKTFRHW